MKYFWINIASSRHRKNFMTDQFERLKFENERIDAITPQDLLNYNIMKHPKTSSTNHEFACILSHLSAIKKGYEQNLEYFVVCEDDMFIPMMDDNKLMDCLKNYESKFGCSIDLLQMYISGHPFIVQLYNDHFVKQRQLIKKIEENIYSSAGFYLVSRKGAKDILDKFCIDKTSYDLSCHPWTVADNLLFISTNSFVLTYPLTICNTNFLSEIHIHHYENHVVANNIIKQIQEKNNKIHLLTDIENTKQIKMLLHSGMCNQMFMMFATIAYAIRNDFDYVFYTNNTRSLDNKTPNYFNNLVDKIKHKTTMYIEKDIPSYLEQDFAYKEIPHFDKSFNTKGFFQSYKYFDKEFDEIMKITGIYEQREYVRKEFIEIFNQKPCISIHFRMGDYLGLQQYHPILPVQYYRNCLKYLEKHINLHDYNILYFCQKCDNETVQGYINNININNYNFIKIDDNIPDWKQMLMISSCSHHIIANSTFSWWGAYIADKDKIVCTPIKKWFGPALTHHDTNDLCPPEWISIDF